LNIEILINNLMDYYHVKSITELAEKLKTSQSTISGWRSRNAIGALTSTVASVDEEALSHIFASKVQTNNLQGAKIGASGVTNTKGDEYEIDNSPSTHANLIPEYILDELNALFKRVKDKKKEDSLIYAIEDFIALQIKQYRESNK